MSQTCWFYCLLGCMLWLRAVDCMSSGPVINNAGFPTNFQYSCQALQPNPAFHGQPNIGDGGYQLTISPPMTTADQNGFTFSPGQVYNIELSGTVSFRGFLVQARVPSNIPSINTAAMLLGAFATDGQNQQTLDCDNALGTMTEASISHQNVAGLPNFDSVAFTWTAPSTGDMEVDFFYTVVRMQTNHFDAISASAVGVNFQATTEQPTTETIANATEPVADTTEPIATTAEPVTNATEPIANATEPIAPTTEPVANATEPIANATEPIATTTEPVANATEPIANATEPIATTTELIANTTEPTTEPIANTTEQEPTTAFTGTGTQGPETVGPPVISEPIRSDNQYRLRLFDPPACVPPLCDIFVGIDTNTGDRNFLDIVLEGRVEGWLAVGFSSTNDMFDADVVACNRFGDNITALDAFNPPDIRTSQIDNIQDVILFSNTFIDGILRCVITKRIAPSDNQDIDLSQDLFLIHARRETPSSSLNILETHSGEGTRGVSEVTFNPSSAVAVIGPDEFDAVHRPNLIRAHGILMIIAWPLLGLTGIFFALFLRPALPNGEWLLAHRILMMISLGLTSIGFILIFIALKNTEGRVVGGDLSLAHMIIGIIILALQMLNPIIAIFRCAPDGKRRWIFNLLHGSMIGFIAEMLSFINVSFGLSIFTELFSITFETTRIPLWLFLGFIGFYLFIVIVGVIIFAVYSCRTGNKDYAPSVAKSFVRVKTMDNESMPMEMDESPGYVQANDGDDEKPRKNASKDAPIRWGWLWFFLGVSVPVLLAVIVMVAFP